MPRFVPVASPNPSAPMAQGRGRFTPVTGGQRFTPVSQPMQPGSSPPLGTPLSNQLLGGIGAAKGAIGLGQVLTGQSPITTGAQTGLGALKTGVLASQGQAVPATLAGIGTVGSGMQLASQLGGLSPTLGKLGGGIGAAAGIGSGIYDLTQGGSGQDLAFGMASLANPAFGLVAGGSQLAGMAMDALVGAGRFGQTPLPFAERGLNWSSAENAASQTSKMRAIKKAEALQGMIAGATDPRSLLAMAGMNADPFGEVQFAHPQLGNQEALRPVLQQIAATNDPALLRQFLGGVQIQTGEGGTAAPNFALTDWYRRQLASLSPGLQGNMAGLFEPVPEAYLTPLREMAAIPLERLPQGWQLDRGYSPEDLTLPGSIYNPMRLSSLLRDPQEMAMLQALRAASDRAYTSPDLAQYVDRQTYPGYYGGVDQPPAPWPSQQAATPPEPQPGTPEWYAKYAPL